MSFLSLYLIFPLPLTAPCGAVTSPSALPRDQAGPLLPSAAGKAKRILLEGEAGRDPCPPGFRLLPPRTHSALWDHRAAAVSWLCSAGLDLSLSQTL